MSRFQEIVNQVPEPDRTIVALAARRYMNSVADQRPSDAALAIVTDYLRDPVGFVARETELRRRERC
jgi:hypothetical protein